MERIYKSEPMADKQAFFEGCSQGPAFKHLAFALAFFHCVVVGRRSGQASRGMAHGRHFAWAHVAQGSIRRWGCFRASYACRLEGRL